MPLIPNSYTKDNIVIGTIAQGRSQGVDDLAIVCAIACELVESNLTMYGNEGDPETLNFPYQALSEDKNSSGTYQQRPPWWGTPAQRMDVRASTKMFLDSLVKQRPNYHDNPGEAIANTQNPRRDLRWKYGARLDEAWGWFNRLKNANAHEAMPPAIPSVFAAPKPFFTEFERFGWGSSARTRPIINFFLHTQEGSPDATAEDLAEFCNGSNNVSYHYTLRNRILCDVVDTDRSSWSVLDANVFSINLCFAGSFAGDSTVEWMRKFKDDIDIAAYIAVQDCHKYPQMSSLVIPPPYSFRGPGISDHKYVTQKLGIGNHTDVGPNFPWAYFESRVLAYSGFIGAGDNMTKEEHDALLQLWGSQFNLDESASPYAPPGEGKRWANKDKVKNIDGMQHAIFVEHNAIVLGIPKDIELIHAGMTWEDEEKAARAKLAWARIPQQFKERAGFVSV